MDFIVGLLPFLGSVLLAIMILVFVHEMGHFLAAKLFGMRVDRFSVGFPPNLLKKKIGETEYVLGATPLGGYVKIDGMVDESLDAENLASDPQPWEFRAKPVWQRIVVITAGVIFNMILAWVILTGLKATYGEAYVPVENIEGVYVTPDSPAYAIGLRTGDRIVSVGGEPLTRMDDLLKRLLMTDSLTVAAERSGQVQVFAVPEDMITQLNRSEGKLGVWADPNLAGDVVAGSPADAAGLQKGDRIVQVGAQPVAYWQQLTEAVQTVGGAATPVRFYRADTLAATTPDTARVREIARDAEGRTYETTLVAEKAEGDSLYRMGIFPPDQKQVNAFLGVRQQRYGLGEAMVAGPGRHVGDDGDDRHEPQTHLHRARQLQGKPGGPGGGGTALPATRIRAGLGRFLEASWRCSPSRSPS